MRACSALLPFPAVFLQLQINLDGRGQAATVVSHAVPVLPRLSTDLIPLSRPGVGSLLNLKAEHVPSNGSVQLSSAEFVEAHATLCFKI